MMGSAALGCIINEAFMNDIDIFVDNIHAFEDIHNYLVVQGYYSSGQQDMNTYSGMSIRTAGNFPIVVYKYTLPGAIVIREIQIVFVKDFQEARDLVDIAACQSSFDGKIWTVPATQVNYLSCKQTWHNYNTTLLSTNERLHRVHKYESKGFTFIERPDAYEDDLVDAVNRTQIR